MTYAETLKDHDLAPVPSDKLERALGVVAVPLPSTGDILDTIVDDDDLAAVPPEMPFIDEVQYSPSQDEAIVLMGQLEIALRSDASADEKRRSFVRLMPQIAERVVRMDGEADDYRVASHGSAMMTSLRIFLETHRAVLGDLANKY